MTEFLEVRHRPAPNVFVGISDRGMRQGQNDRQMMGERTGTVYRIVVRSELSDRYAVAFEGMEMEAKDGRTILTGEIIDEPHLHGILDRIGDLGLELLSVHALGEEVHPSAEEERELQRDRPHDRCSVGRMTDVGSATWPMWHPSLRVGLHR